MDSHQRDNLIDAVLFSTMFYILSHSEVLTFMANHVPFQDPRLTNTILFGISFVVVHKLTNRI